MFYDKNAGSSILEQELRDPKELEKEFLYMELARLSDEDREAFVKSEQCQQLMEAGLISKKTLIRLSKNDDLSRRRKMVAFQLAKEKNDPLWKALVKNRIKERQLIRAIATKYRTGADRGAKIAQKEYLKSIHGKMAPLR